MRQAAVAALREMGREAKGAIPALAEVLRDQDQYVAIDASHVLEGMGPDAVPSLLPLLRDCQPRVRELAARDFAAHRAGRQAGRYRARRATSGQGCFGPSGRSLCSREMGPDGKAAIPALAEVLRDRDRYVAVDASHVLERMGPEAVPSLVALLRDCQPRVRQLAALTLRQIGSDAVLVSPQSGR